MTTFFIWVLVFANLIGWGGFWLYEDAYQDELQGRFAAEEAVQTAAEHERVRVMKFIRSLGIFETTQLNAAALGTSVAMLNQAIQALATTPHAVAPGADVAKSTSTSSAATHRGSTSGPSVSHR